MIATIGDFQIDSVAVIDDDPTARDTYKMAIEDMDSEPVLEDGPLTQLDTYVADLRSRVSAAFCDFHLKKHEYANFNGDELTARLYGHSMPVILCTEYASWKTELHRGFRRNIPVVISYNDADPDTIFRAYELCVAEFSGEFLDTRRPIRTLVRIDEIDLEDHFTYVVVPGWSARSRVRIQNDNLPPKVLAKLKGGQMRVHAKVNLGAEADEDLFFTDWEL